MFHFPKVENIANNSSSTYSARLAQSVEHETLNLRVVGSSPTLGDTFFDKKYKLLQCMHNVNVFPLHRRRGLVG